MIPAVGIGYAVQNPDTPYIVFLILALLCGFGGGNFASSMANISLLLPEGGEGQRARAQRRPRQSRRQCRAVPGADRDYCRGLRLARRRSVMVKGPTQQAPLWLQNAGFIWVPFIAACAFAAWFGMNDIASAKASFTEQAVIFQRKHNWLMCWLYTGTFGSFIGYSAGFPLLAKTLFPEVNALQFVFLGPLVGALSRSATGWLADQIRRRPRHLLGLHPDDGRRRRRALLPRHQGSARRVLGLLRDASWSCSSPPASAMPPPSR